MIHTDLDHKRILLLGYGIEARATEQYLRYKAPHSTIAHADERDNPDLWNKQQDFDLVIRSPGVPKRKVKNPSYTTATNIFFAHVQGYTIGITGTKGKSTTASLIAHMLKTAGKKVCLAGNIGMPLLQGLIKKEQKKDVIYVCELSSYQLDDAAYSPHISVVINIFPDHLPYHGSMEAYVEAKHTMLKYADPSDIYVYNPAFEVLRSWSTDFPGRTYVYPNVVPFSLDQITLVGEHNKDNIRAAYRVAKLYDIPDSTLETAIHTFEPLPHRLQYVGTWQDIAFYDDAISTTPESTIAGMKSILTIGTILLGGEDRGYDFTQLAEELAQRKVLNIVLFPPSGERIEEKIQQQNNYAPRILHTSSMEEAVRFVYQYSPAHMSCLLSTASPSYSIWKDFHEKGSLYQQFVKQYATEKNYAHTVS